jgi:hypothetical protein
MVLERLVGIDFSIVDRAIGATADGILTIRDFLPADWERADVKIPFKGGQWAVVAIERVNATSKRITVSGNPLGALALQPALGSKKTLVSAQPKGWTKEASGERVDWLFVDDAAKEASVVVEWASA